MTRTLFVSRILIPLLELHVRITCNAVSVCTRVLQLSAKVAPAPLNNVSCNFTHTSSLLTTTLNLS
jgi:hypothetical protein